MKIGIWGSYDKGNFGDDLMAFMIVDHLRSNGFDPILFCATDFLRNECNCESIDNINDFVKKVDIVVIGGGGMLINNSLLRFFVREVAFSFEISFYKLYKALRKYGKQIIPISIGGDGNSFLNNPYKTSVFSAPLCKGGTVRLNSDLKTVSNSLFKYYSDIVLSTSAFFSGIETDNSLNNVVLLNLKKSNGLNFYKEFSEFGRQHGMDVFTYTSHIGDSRKNLNYELAGKNNLEFTSLRDSIKIFKSVKSIISSKLHVGVAALSFGTPFFSYNGPSKAKEFLKSVNLDEYIIEDTAFFLKKVDDGILENRIDIDQHKLQSRMHFDRLDYLIGKL